MDTEHILHTYKSVCGTPSGSGFHIDYMPDFLYKGEIDDGCPHVHTFYEIIWFQEGRGTHTVDFQNYPVRPNTLFFLAPGQVHHFDGSSDYKGLTIKLCTDFMRTQGEGSDLFLKYDVFHTFDRIPYYMVDDTVAQQLAVLVKDMEAELEAEGEFGHLDIIRSLLKIFLIKVHRYGTREGEVRLDELKPSHRLFVQFRQMVENEFTRLHTVQEYADALHVAVRTLNKCVNDCTDKSPLAFINERIILEAKRLVRHTDMMFKEISYELGFEDSSYFVKFFKRQTGYLPSDFRELDLVSHCPID